VRRRPPLKEIEETLSKEFRNSALPLPTLEDRSSWFNLVQVARSFAYIMIKAGVVTTGGHWKPIRLCSARPPGEFIRSRGDPGTGQGARP
jgi:hypothetical protein